MTTAPLRRDAARNWQRIVDVGRQLVDDGTPIQLNDVARAAGVGVATVYRHFPTPEALLETVAAPGLEALAAHAGRALAEADAGAALSDFLHAAVAAQASDAALPPVFAAASVLPRTAELKRQLTAAFGRMLERAHAAGAVNPGLTTEDMIPLMCGVMFAAKVHPGRSAEHFLSVLLDGVRRRS